MSKVTAPQDAHRRLVLQVYLGSNTLSLVLYVSEILALGKQSSLLLSHKTIRVQRKQLITVTKLYFLVSGFGSLVIETI